MNDFDIAMVQVLDKHTANTIWSGMGIGRLLDAYETLVSAAQDDKYKDEDGGLYEFENDLNVRQVLNSVITDPEVNQYNELQSILSRVHALDDKMMQTDMRNDFTAFAHSHHIQLAAE